MKLNEILKKYWGFDQFRPLQLEIIQSVLQGRDTLGLMPTGGGKSITFQVPALSRPGLCVVVSPLIALMKDQVESLRSKDIKAVAVYSGMTNREIDTALTNCIYGDYKFLYLSPERTDTDLFIHRLREMNVNLIAVDEAHCISQWGYDFRPSYLKLSELRNHLPGIPVLALTATATHEVAEDIQEKLLFAERNVIKMSFERKNLSYIVRQVEDKQKYLLQTLKKVPGSGIIYVRNRLRTKETADFLERNGISAHFYHAGLSSELRSLRQDQWKSGQTRVMVATNAFGMGIDKSDVRFVVHLDLPDSIEAYFQEAGRAGRDEIVSYAVLLYHPSDRLRLERQHKANFPSIQNIKRVYQCLGDFLQIPEGSGQFMTFDFEISQFIKTYKLELMLAYHSLKTLEREGYINYEEYVDHSAKLLFLVPRDDLYRFRVANAPFDEFIKLILRTYTGLFTDYTPIDIHALALRAKISPDTANDFLKRLDQLKIIDYIPRRNNPVIFYNQPRYESRLITVSEQNYRIRRERYEERLNAVFHYAEQSKQCRSSVLLEYFGEKNTKPCGQCDYCLQKMEGGLTRYERQHIRQQIEQMVQESPVSIDTLIEDIKTTEDKAFDVLRKMMDEGLLYISDQREIVRKF